MPTILISKKSGIHFFYHDSNRNGECIIPLHDNDPKERTIFTKIKNVKSEVDLQAEEGFIPTNLFQSCRNRCVRCWWVKIEFKKGTTIKKKRIICLNKKK